MSSKICIRYPNSSVWVNAPPQIDLKYWEHKRREKMALSWLIKGSVVVQEPDEKTNKEKIEGDLFFNVTADTVGEAVTMAEEMVPEIAIFEASAVDPPKAEEDC